MQNLFKKLISYLLIKLVLFLTVIGLLGVWEIIKLHNVLPKIMSSLIIIFSASAVMLFITNVVMKDRE